MPRVTRTSHHLGLLVPGALAATLVLGACSTDAEVSTGADGTALTVTASDDTCDVSSTDLPAGLNTFEITNQGGTVTEVYVYADGDRIMAEKENIGPGTSYRLTADLPQGAYQVACKPGMVGDGIREAITVTAAEGAPAPSADPAVAKAVTDYRAFVQEQADALIPLVTEFAGAIKAGDVEKAKALYAPSRIPWERVEPVAESFGDIDPKVDLREADLEPGQEWTGWHRLEKALWVGGDVSDPEIAAVADRLVADVTDFRGRVATADMNAASIGNGAKELIDEVATGKITGEEDIFSHTDLVDFDANVEGSRKAFDVLRPIVETRTPDLVTRLDGAFTAVDAELAKYATADGYVSYDTVTEPQRRELARVIDALGEPLSQLTASAVS